MSLSNEASNFFQTSDALANSERKSAKAKNKQGNPIKLPSKILAACPDPYNGGALFVAEAAGEVKHVVAETSKVRKIFTRVDAPITCISVSPQTSSLFAGSWDKNIYQIQLDGSKSPEQLSGHNDFLKCLLATSLNGKPVLVSGGADAAILVWDLESRKQLYKLKGHTKALQDLAIDPFSLADGESEPRDAFILFTASSDREIRRWHISLDSAYELSESLGKPILAHETSVYKLCFDSDGDLWTASADKTAKHLVRNRDWEADTVLQHPDFIRDVAISERLGVVVTACRDEEVRLWDSASGNLLCTYSGHFEEVTGLVLMGSNVISVSLDGTIRTWGLRKQDMQRYEEEQKRAAVGDDSETSAKKGANLLTEDEEAELAELMDED